MKSTLCVIASLLLVCSGYCQTSGVLNTKPYVYVSGQFPIDSTTGQLVSGSMEDVTTLTIKNMEHLLKIKGASLKQVVKTTIYLSNIRDLEAMYVAYAQMFNSGVPPTSEVVEVSNMPYGARIQMSCIADLNR